MQLVAGVVIRISDQRVTPRGKSKWHICVCPERRLFLRINSKPLWPPHHPIAAASNSFLDHDSHVELTQLHFFSESELRRAERIGDMAREEARALAKAAQGAVTLNQDDRDLIWRRLSEIS